MTTAPPSTVPASTATLPALASAIADWFPELGGRAFAVSEAEVTPENIPTLPLAMVALQKETARQYDPRTRGEAKIEEDVLVQFWMRPERYRLADGSQSPFWAYYDYHRVRNALLARAWDWVSPAGARLEYKSLDIEADQYAVILTFRFGHEFIFCPDSIPDARPLECYGPLQLVVGLGSGEPLP